jgi:hypothetical protein
MADRNLECNLAYIKSNFGTLPKTIIPLELSGRILAYSIQILIEFQNKSHEIKNEREKIIQLKLKDVFKKNTGFNTICNISKILKGTDCLERLFQMTSALMTWLLCDMLLLRL